MSEQVRTTRRAGRAGIAAASVVCWLAFAPAALAGAEDEAGRGATDGLASGSGDAGERDAAPLRPDDLADPAPTHGAKNGQSGSGADTSKPSWGFDLDTPMSVDEPICGEDAPIVA